MRSQFTALLAIAVCTTFIVSTSATSGPQSQRQSQRQPTGSYTLDDTLTLISDGQGPYDNDKKAGVVSAIGSSQWRTSFTKAGRSWNVDLSSPVDPLNAPVGGRFTCDYGNQSFMYVLDIESLPVGSAALRRMAIRLSRVYEPSSGQYIYTNIWFTPPEPQYNHAIDNRVSVTRVSPTSWSITTQPGNDLGWLTVVHGDAAGNIITTDALAYYHVPLSISLR